MDEKTRINVIEKLNLITDLVNDAQRQTANMGYIEHHGEIRLMVKRIKILLKKEGGAKS